MAIYAREGVRHAWLVGPEARTLEVLRPDGAGWSTLSTFSAGALVRAEPFEAIEVDLKPLWDP